jgi:hypothetical protein
MWSSSLSNLLASGYSPVFRKDRNASASASAGAGASDSDSVGLLAPDSAGVTSQKSWINLNVALRTAFLTVY